MTSDMIYNLRDRCHLLDQRRRRRRGRSCCHGQGIDSRTHSSKEYAACGQQSHILSTFPRTSTAISLYIDKHYLPPLPSPSSFFLLTTILLLFLPLSPNLTPPPAYLPSPPPPPPPPTHHLGREVDLTRGLMPSLYRLFVLLKLTMLKMTLCSDRTLFTVK